MTSLTEHFRREDHAVLPFHAGCPVCRAARLQGSPPDTLLIDRRTSAGLIAALVLGSAGAPVGAIAAPPPNLSPEDISEVGGAPVESEGGEIGEGEGDPDEPEGPLPPDAGAIPPPPPGEAETDVPAEAPEPPAPAPAAPPAQAPSVPAPPAPQAVQPEVPPVPQPEAGPAPEPAPAPQSAPVNPPAPANPPATDQDEPQHTTASEPAPVVEQPPAAPAPATAGQDAEAAPAQVPPGADQHVVRSGETLWSIARAALGPDARAAEIARYVDRLWSVNAERIGTGDPDLIVTGTKLLLP